ncbi:hypothetical protein [Lysinibacillus xylanilyticus]|uniref:hypothetical protein n=1 Tax=Lysinibacillus xylanilyticus TaxID=582475 RepID=UPI003D08BFFC
MFSVAKAKQQQSAQSERKSTTRFAEEPYFAIKNTKRSHHINEGFFLLLVH